MAIVSRTWRTIGFGRRRPVGIFGLIARWVEVARQRRALSRLDSTQLDDIGLTRKDVSREAARPFWDYYT
ncbi:MAG: DUF1127 domain-containing protein [Pseudomonadota bacterium]